MSVPPRTSPAPSALPDASRAEIQAELNRILQSPEFRQSKQSERLLRFLVDRSIDGRVEDLRERAIGVELFGREPGYDTNNDPLVRVRANEVRKRLARYYAALAEPPAVRIDLPAGGYRLEFIGPGSAPAAAVSLAAVRSLPKWKLWSGVAGLLAASALILWWWSAPGILEQFWAPAVGARRPVIVCSGHPVVYKLSREFWNTRRRQPDHFRTQTEVLRFAPDEKVPGKDIVAVEDQYTGIGSAVAIARITAWLATQGKPADIRFGDDLSFTDLRLSPSVMVGFANRWTLDLSKNLRFTNDTFDRGPGVRDRQTGKTYILGNLRENGRTEEDYVVISRVFDSQSGQPMVLVAGLTQYGTQAGGEILTNAALLAPALAQARPGWQRRNVQLLYHVQVIGHTPGAPQLIAIHEW